MENLLARQSGLKLSDFAHVIDSRRAGLAKRADNRNNACGHGLASRMTVNKMAAKCKKQKTTLSKSKTKNVKKIDYVFSFNVINFPANIFTAKFQPEFACNRSEISARVAGPARATGPARSM